MKVLVLGDIQITDTSIFQFCLNDDKIGMIDQVVVPNNSMYRQIAEECQFTVVTMPIQWAVNYADCVVQLGGHLDDFDGQLPVYKIKLMTINKFDMEK